MAPIKKKQKLSDGAAANVQHFEDQPEVEQDPSAQGVAESAAEEKAAQQKRSLFVRSLPATTTTESLTELFSDSYPVKHATAVIDPATKQCRGYGFVTFADAEDAARAREEFNGHVLEGRKLRVEIAEPRHRDGEGETSIKPAKELEQPPKLIVRNLPWSIKRSEQLSKLFLSYGKVKNAYIPTKAPGLMAGFGFVIMRGRKNAEKAIAGVNGKEVDGRTLAVDWAVAKKVYDNVITSSDQTDDKLTAADSDMKAVEDLDADMEDEADGSGDEDEELDTSENERKESEETDEDDGVEIDLGDATVGAQERPSQGRESTLFVRNLPFTCTDEDLEDHFAQFGSTRYARVVMDFGTERSKGTGFVCFYKRDDADTCLRNAPKSSTIIDHSKADRNGKASQPGHSVLQNEAADPSGQYTMDGRVLQVSQAVDKSEASRLTQQGMLHRSQRDKDKRRLYLLSEGTISTRSKLWESLPPSEKSMREASAKQRKSLIESNPSLHLSLTRLSIRNIPRSVGSKELKALARDAIVGFASDVKAGLRERLSKEELSRNGEDMQAAEAARKRAGKGVVKQAKVVFEGTSGSKVSEDSGAGRSRGYGFIEYYTHRNALMGLRWLNGHAVGYQVGDGKAKPSREDAQDRKKRLIVEFAIENAQVVHRRREREDKARDRSHNIKHASQAGPKNADNDRSRTHGARSNVHKQKRRLESRESAHGKPSNPDKVEAASKKPVDEKLARRNQIIGRKRAMRRARQGAKG